MPLISRLGLLALGSVGSGLVTYAHCKEKSPIPGPRVAILGAGVGGASCAYFLRARFGDAVTIDVYEKNKIGGRTAVTAVCGHEFEAGASIIHGKNRYLVDFAKEFKLDKKQSPNSIFGFSDGKEIYFNGSEDAVSTIFRTLWRYGVDLPRAVFFVVFLLEKFKRIYSLQDQGHAFTSVHDLMHATSSDFINMSQQSLGALLFDNGFGAKFTDEVAMAAVRNNYGQSVQEIHGFAGFVALAGIDSDLWSVKGGNYQIPRHLINHSKANLIAAEVKEVILLENGQYEVSYDGMKPRYDVVVLAYPQTERNELKISGLKRKVDLKSPYKRIVTNFIRGVVNENRFEFSGLFPTELTITNPQSCFNTLAVNTPVQGSKDKIDPKEINVWKIFSKRPLSDEEFKEIFSRIDSKTSVDWLAYPEYRVGESFPSFVIYKNLFYLNAIERAASCMEMSAIAGRNIALLVYNEWHGLYGKIDNQTEIQNGGKNSFIRGYGKGGIA